MLLAISPTLKESLIKKHNLFCKGRLSEGNLGVLACLYMFVKIHKSYRNVVAICDSELIGKKFEEEKFQIDVKENFFKGDKVTENEAISIMKRMLVEDATFNIIGEKSVRASLKAGVISKDGIKKIGGIPFALVLA